MDTVKISYSNGRSRNGSYASYVRPAQDCLNKSRRIVASTPRNLETGIEMCIKEHYTPMLYYRVDGRIIGSSSPEKALREYWTICEREKIGKPFEVIEMSPVPAH